MRTHFLVPGLVCLTLAGCGIKGPLYLPDPPAAPAKPAAPASAPAAGDDHSKATATDSRTEQQ